MGRQDWLLRRRSGRLPIAVMCSLACANLPSKAGDEPAGSLPKLAAKKANTWARGSRGRVAHVAFFGFRFHTSLAIAGNTQRRPRNGRGCFCSLTPQSIPFFPIASLTSSRSFAFYSRSFSISSGWMG
jgi:hypothetical protein